MPHTAVPAAELAARLENLRRAISAAHPDWGMILLDSKIDLYYFTGTMQEGALAITPDEAALFVPCATPASPTSVRLAASAALHPPFLISLKRFTLRRGR